MEEHANVLKHYCDRLREELSDVETYGNLYEVLMSQGMREDAEVIEEIAEDELSHAMALYKLLEIHHHEIDTETKARYHKARELFRLS